MIATPPVFLMPTDMTQCPIIIIRVYRPHTTTWRTSLEFQTMAAQHTTCKTYHATTRFFIPCVCCRIIEALQSWLALHNE